MDVAFASAILILAFIGWLSYRNTEAMIESDRWEDHAYATIQEFDKLLFVLQDLEIGQRGYVITGEEEYLKPYNDALNSLWKRLDSLNRLTQQNPRNWLPSLRRLIEARVAEAEKSIELRRSGGFRAALQFIETDNGKLLMDEIRRRVAEDEQEEMRMLKIGAEEKSADVSRSVRTVVGGSSLSFLLLCSVFLALKKQIAQRTKAENELLSHRNHLQELVNERTLKLQEANALLQNEIAEHKETEKELRQARDELEFRVNERTSELSKTVDMLNAEIEQRRPMGGLGGARTSFSFDEASCAGTAVCSNSTVPVGASSHFQLHAGAGVEIFLTDNLFIRPQVDLRYIPNFTDQFGSNVVPGGMFWIGFRTGSR